jgi:hypothetical protein
MEENNDLKEPFELFGVECDKGWYDIIKPLFNYIEEYNKENPDNEIKVLQVKEKFGELRFYVSHGDETLYKMIDKAENESLKTCEHCGSKENVIHTDRWIWTVCKNCLKESVKKSNRTVTFWENNKHYMCNSDGIKEI